MKILFIQPPVKMRPIYEKNIDDYFFILSLSYITISSVILKNGFKNFKLISCPIKKIGWMTLKKILLEEKPDIVLGSADTTLGAEEIGNLAKVAKETNPNCKVIVGGYHATALPEETMSNYPVDIVVLYEGDETIIELLEELQNANPNLHRIKGIAFRENNRFIKTEPRRLIKDLDSLPIYDEAYKILFYEHPMLNSLKHKVIKLQSSRGCIANCDFCAGWVQMGEYVKKDGKDIIIPFYRKKSPERVVDEIEYFYNKYKISNFYFTDDCFNGDLLWSDKFADIILKKNIKVSFFAFLCADNIIKDEKEKVFEKLIRAGLSSTLIGVERCDNTELMELNKGRYNMEKIIEAFSILRKYPSLLSIASLLVGFPDDSNEKIVKMFDFCLHKLKADIIYPFCFIPLPGTKIWEKMREDGFLQKILSQNTYSQFDPNYPLFDTKYLKRDELFRLINYLRFKYLVRPLSIKRGFFNKYFIPAGDIKAYYMMMFRLCYENIKILKSPFAPRPDLFKFREPEWYND